MKMWSARASARGPSAAPDDSVVTAVDAALGFVAGQRCMGRQLAIALLETVRDAARDIDAPELHVLIDAALAACAQDSILAAWLTDQLLDIRNVTREAQGVIQGGMQ